MKWKEENEKKFLFRNSSIVNVAIISRVPKTIVLMHELIFVIVILHANLVNDEIIINS